MNGHKKRYYSTGVLTVLLTTAFCTFQAYAAPVITVTKGSPPEKQAPPYTIEFSVSDPVGIVSIVANGKEHGPNGGDYYELDYLTFYNGTINITAVNRNGESSSKSVQITNLTTALEQPQVERPTAPPQTQAPSPPPPQTQPQTTQARVPETTQAPTTKAEETEPVKTSPAEETIEETEGSQTEEIETAAEESSPTEETEPETKETIEETTAPELPPDSYKLYPGERKNKMVPPILICACICAIGYLITTILLNRKRLKKYKQFHKVLIKRQDMITQKDYERFHENTIDGLPEDEEAENEFK